MVKTMANLFLDLQEAEILKKLIKDSLTDDYFETNDEFDKMTKVYVDLTQEIRKIKEEDEAF